MSDDHPIYSEKDVAYMVGSETARQTKLVEDYQQKMHEELERVTTEYTRIAKRSFYLGMVVGASGTIIIASTIQILYG